MQEQRRKAGVTCIGTEQTQVRSSWILKRRWRWRSHQELLGSACSRKDKEEFRSIGLHVLTQRNCWGLERIYTEEGEWHSQRVLLVWVLWRLTLTDQKGGSTQCCRACQVMPTASCRFLPHANQTSRVTKCQPVRKHSLAQLKLVWPGDQYSKDSSAYSTHKVLFAFKRTPVYLKDLTNVGEECEYNISRWDVKRGRGCLRKSVTALTL